MDFTFLSRPPRPPLDRFVESLWYAHGRVPYGRERILPNGRAVLILNRGDPFHIEHAVGPERVRHNRSAWMSGVQTAYVLNEPLGLTHAVGVVFRPVGVAPFLGAPLSELTDRFVDLDALWGPSALALRDRVGEAASPAAMFDCVEAHLTARLDHPGDHWRIVSAAADLLTRSAMPRVAEAAQALGVSRKHLSVLFDRYVGVSPKSYARIQRFNRVLEGEGLSGPCRLTPRLADLAQACGYYDQAHFNHDFAAFAGVTPSAYLHQRALHFGDRAAQAETRLFVPGG